MNKFESKVIKEFSKDLIFSGTDEAGRGCLAGPLVVSAVILPKDYYNSRIKDSKKLTKNQRTILATEIKQIALSYATKVISVELIESLNPKQASILGMQNANDELLIKPDLILTDAEKLGPNYNYKAIINGDNLSQSIAAASILAKVTRDQIMEDFDKEYPNYDFKNNKGYGTKKHLGALAKNGFCPIHRKTYRPIRDMILAKNVTNK